MTQAKPRRKFSEMAIMRSQKVIIRVYFLTLKNDILLLLLAQVIDLRIFKKPFWCFEREELIWYFWGDLNLLYRPPSSIPGYNGDGEKLTKEMLFLCDCLTIIISDRRRIGICRRRHRCIELKIHPHTPGKISIGVTSGSVV